jgi:hypothetical protein
MCPGQSSRREQRTTLYVRGQIYGTLVHQVKGASTTSHKCQHQGEGRHRQCRRAEPRDDGDRYGLQGELKGVRKDDWMFFTRRTVCVSDVIR